MENTLLLYQPADAAASIAGDLQDWEVECLITGPAAGYCPQCKPATGTIFYHTDRFYVSATPRKYLPSFWIDRTCQQSNFHTLGRPPDSDSFIAYYQLSLQFKDYINTLPFHAIL